MKGCLSGLRCEVVPGLFKSDYDRSTNRNPIYMAEECLSGLRCIVGNDVWRKSPQVRILSPPPCMGESECAGNRTAGSNPVSSTILNLKKD